MKKNRDKEVVIMKKGTRHGNDSWSGESQTGGKNTSEIQSDEQKETKERNKGGIRYNRHICTHKQNIKPDAHLSGCPKADNKLLFLVANSKLILKFKGEEARAKRHKRTMPRISRKQKTQLSAGI